MKDTRDMNSYYNEPQTKRPRVDSTSDPLLKLLVPNYAAGSLIGKGGSVLTELQNKFGGRIRLSANKEFYPGTQERVVVLTGETVQLHDLNSHIMEVVRGNVPDAMYNHDASLDGGREQEVQIVLTNNSAGLLIGRAGATIRSIKHKSKATLKLQQKDAGSVPGERVLTVHGTSDQQSDACRLIIEKIAGDESNRRNNNLRYTGTGAATGINSQQYSSHNAQQYSTQNAQQYSSQNAQQYSTQNAQQYSTQNAQQYSSQNAMPYVTDYRHHGYMQETVEDSVLKTTSVTVEVEVPNIIVPALLGKGGVNIIELVRASGGARFKFSDKDDFVPGTNNRKLTITCSSIKQAEAAYLQLSRRVARARSELAM